MHLLTARPGGFCDEEGIIDLQQSPAEIVILSSQDTSLGLLAECADALAGHYPTVRLANLANLAKPAAYDLYEHSVLQHAGLILVSLLGGSAYWQYGIDRLEALAAHRKINLVVVPGDDQPDPQLVRISNCHPEQRHAIWRYLREGGKHNTSNLFAFLEEQFFGREGAAHGFQSVVPPPAMLPFSLIHDPLHQSISLDQWLTSRDDSKPNALLLFYRSHVQSGNTDAFDRFIEILGARFNVLAVASLSLKNPDCMRTINHLIEQSDCHVVINTTSFSQHVEGNASLSSEPQVPTRLFERNIPVIQAILAANSEQDWAQSAQGLRSRDIAMNVALPEYDGRIIGRAVSFKTLFRHSDQTQMDVIRYRLNPERAGFIASLAAGWAALSIRPNRDKRIALILANYPTRNGRIGNGVGLDTPASVINILHGLQQAGFPVDGIPDNGDAMIERLQSTVTNDADTNLIKACNQSLALNDYLKWFGQLPPTNRDQVIQRWGTPESDPMVRNGRIMVSGLLAGDTFVGIQPARGYNLDVAACYHDPDLAPPHGYIAFYFWVRHIYRADAIAHIGKHGSLEWLPGKSVALSQQCWPDAILGPIPHLYPFIVNDPGEGAQAKRRTAAVVLDHLTPPMARAEIYGELIELENLVDEYYQAAGLDSRREAYLKDVILQKLAESNLRGEIGADNENDQDVLLGRLDTWLCDLKESQVRHGLHRFGRIPDPHKLAETLVALTRLPRGERPQDSGLLHCLCHDLGLVNADQPFDPLRFDPAAPWRGTRPEMLAALCGSYWRTEADTRERLELLAEQCVQDTLSGRPLDPVLVTTKPLLQYIVKVVAEAISDSARDEIDNLIGALEGRFVPAGPSGAPTRGRLDVLPTGRNFYALDSRSIPTRSAWDLGQRSADELLARHLQEQGEYPRQLGISVWGTSTMRTGGDDIAQAFALIGVRPVWAEGSNRVMDIEVIPGFLLARPRVDVTLRISGFFRDAFPNVAKLFDTAVQALAGYQEPGDSNVVRENIDRDTCGLIAGGMDSVQAEAQARFRVFGSKPGGYGAGLQRLIDHGVWKDGSDLAQAYVNWGGYSYSQSHFGKAAFAAFESRLGQLEAVVQNQDNREHDVLDSDDYYQFQGGMSNAVEVLRGQQPIIYHGDHSNPANPRIRTLKEEINRVIRSRVINPKWIAAMREHGYKGAFEMAAAVDYLFAYDATTALVDDYQYEAVTDALVFDPENRAFMERSNPHALKEMAERLLEAQQRGLWQAPGDYHSLLTGAILQIDHMLEGLPGSSQMDDSVIRSQGIASAQT